ncbi:MAG TPA: TIGR03936 family radical SAM-associated protein [Kineosporiaceae bacterium]
MPEGPPPEPAVQRLRLRYAKRGRLRFSSHRDFQRAFERAVRRAAVPMAYSAGFTPHPRISYANAAPTGAASEAEYLEIAVTRRCDPDSLRVAVDEALPPGLDVLEVVEAGPGSLADRLAGSFWQLEVPGADPVAVSAAVARFLAAERVDVQRLTKSGMRTFDTRYAVVRLDLLRSEFRTGPGTSAGPAGVVNQSSAGAAQGEPGCCAILQLVVRHTTPAVRPDDVLAGLRSQVHLAPLSPPRMTRLAQGPLDEENGTVADPLAADRNAIGA